MIPTSMAIAIIRIITLLTGITLFMVITFIMVTTLVVVIRDFTSKTAITLIQRLPKLCVRNARTNTVSPVPSCSSSKKWFNVALGGFEPWEVKRKRMISPFSFQALHVMFCSRGVGEGVLQVFRVFKMLVRGSHRRAKVWWRARSSFRSFTSNACSRGSTGSRGCRGSRGSRG